MLGTRIAALRREAGISQAELARRLQVSPSAIGMYEQGRREPSAQMLVKLAQTFHVSTDYLLTGMPACPQENEKLAQVLMHAIADAEQRLEHRTGSPFTRQELAALMVSMLTDT